MCRFGAATPWGAPAAHTCGQLSTRPRAPGKPSGYVTAAAAGGTKGNTVRHHSFIVRMQLGDGRVQRHRGGGLCGPERRAPGPPFGGSRRAAPAHEVSGTRGPAPATASAGFVAVSSHAHSRWSHWPRGRSADLPPCLRVGLTSPDSSPPSPILQSRDRPQAAPSQRHRANSGVMPEAHA